MLRVQIPSLALIVTYEERKFTLIAETAQDRALLTSWNRLLEQPNGDVITSFLATLGTDPPEAELEFEITDDPYEE